MAITGEILLLFLLLASFSHGKMMAEHFMTTADQEYLLKKMPSQQFKKLVGQETLPLTITLDPKQQFQTIEGFGGAITESTAWLFSSRLSKPQRQHYLKILFHPDEGIGINMIRLPVASSDFSHFQYTYDDMPPGQTDEKMQFFSIEHDYQYIIPVLQEILQINPSVQIISSIWSPPAWMKTTDDLTSGEVMEKYYLQYALYVVKFIQGYKQQGIEIFAIAPQNEPMKEPCDYPCALMTAEKQKIFVRDYLRPQFTAHGITTKILIWDHNWDWPEYATTILSDPQARKSVDGIAWHCYGGNPSGQTVAHEQFPEKGQYFTECTGWGSENPSSAFAQDLKWDMKYVVIGNLRNWGKTVFFWNVALDENDGPRNGGCPNCRGIITIPNQNYGSTLPTFNVEFFILGQTSKFIDRGAVRIESDIPDGVLENVAFINEDGTVVVVVFNSDDKDHDFSIVWKDQFIDSFIPAGAVSTYKWYDSGNTKIFKGRVGP